MPALPAPAPAAWLRQRLVFGNRERAAGGAREVLTMNMVYVDPRTDTLWQKLLERYKNDAFHSPGWMRALGDTYDFDVSAYVFPGLCPWTGNRHYSPHHSPHRGGELIGKLLHNARAAPLRLRGACAILGHPFMSAVRV